MKRKSVAELERLALNKTNLHRWFDEGRGIDDIAALTGINRDYVKDCAKQWGLWK